MDQFRHSLPRRSVTLRDVAKAARVSSSAASVILNGANSGTRVSEATRSAVRKIAEDMGYRAHSLAQSLATGTTHRIGFYSGRSRMDCRNPFFSEVLGGVFDQAEEYRLDTVVHTSARVADLVRSDSLDGLVVYAHSGDPILSFIGELSIPGVAIADVIAGLPSVTVDDPMGGLLLARHLKGKGHLHVLIKQSPEPPTSALERVESFESGCHLLGIQTKTMKESWNAEALSRAELALLTEGPNRATAVMCWSDAVAESVCHGLRRANLSIPEDVAVVGFDGFTQRYAPMFDLTTIRAPWAEVGRQAVHHLATLTSGKTIPTLTTLPVSLYKGGTS